ncbi:MAG: DUF1302 family protein [Marinobacter salsuginis]|jgi:hypothetical protein|uniref:DUF1302 family protein n=1 Tax=uncultured Marinobacter sp. TaxID=187379 RepID=UPI000D412BCD|nr:DUF1302 domain-containing protein [Marinobacter sp. B9-2]|tara:strand:- start:1583 stop:3499 length:1917 start_codon:yes stop_codon:yes gene_type:complete
MQTKIKGLSLWCAVFSSTTALTLAALPGTVAAEDTRINGFYENATYARDGVGLSKFRNTIQLEGEKRIGNVGIFSNVSVNGTLRGTYDGVYDLNDDEYGSEAGGPIQLQDIAQGSVPHGGGIAPTPLFGFDINENPNDGMVVLGEHLHDQDNGVAFGVPVRPCDVDSRGCIDDYLDKDEDELRFQEFNDRLDFIRELYVDFDLNFDSGNVLSTRLGKQQVIWGRTDLFRVLDVINPVDYSRNNIYDELEDIRIPMWILKTDYRMGPTEVFEGFAFDDLNFQVVWNFDEFRPHDIGQCGQPNVILDAGCFFRGMNNLWENGSTVANFAGATPDGGLATDFGPGQIGIRRANMPSWKLSNTQLGLKLEGVYGDLGFSLNALTYRSQLPSLRGGIPAQNPFDGTTDVYPSLIAFDIHFPRVNLVGGSLDYYSQGIDTVFRFETAYTSGEEFANTLRERLYSESDVARYVIGADKNVFIPFLNENQSFLFSGQIFGQHILDHEREQRTYGEAGIPDWEHNWIGTLLIQGFYMNNRLIPKLITAHDFRAQATTLAPSVDWIVTDRFKVSAGANIKVGEGARKFDDCRSCNPWDPFTQTPGVVNHQPGESAGLGSFEPLGRFKSGPIGMAQEEDEVQLTVRYSF